MSRELLNRSAKQLQRWHSFYGEHCNKINMENALPPAGDVVLLEEIETYLNKPEPEPVAWVGTGLLPVSSEEIMRMKTYEPGTAALYDTPLYTNPPQKGLMQWQASLNLQAKREPLTNEEILNMSKGNSYPGSTQKIIEFARAIEKAHNIGVTK